MSETLAKLSIKTIFNTLDLVLPAGVLQGVVGVWPTGMMGTGAHQAIGHATATFVSQPRV